MGCSFHLNGEPQGTLQTHYILFTHSSVTFYQLHGTLQQPDIKVHHHYVHLRRLVLFVSTFILLFMNALTVKEVPDRRDRCTISLSQQWHKYLTPKLSAFGRWKSFKWAICSNAEGRSSLGLCRTWSQYRHGNPAFLQRSMQCISVTQIMTEQSEIENFTIEKMKFSINCQYKSVPTWAMLVNIGFFLH